MCCGSAGLQDRRATGGLFLRGDLAVVDRGFKRRFAAEQSGVEGVGGAGITDDGHVILKLNFVGVGEFENRGILDFDLDDRDVFTLIVAFARRRAILLDLERKRAAVGNDDVMELLKTLQVGCAELMKFALKLLGSLPYCCAICWTICQNRACFAFSSPSLVMETTCALVAM